MLSIPELTFAHQVESFVRNVYKSMIECISYVSNLKGLDFIENIIDLRISFLQEEKTWFSRRTCLVGTQENNLGKQ